MALRLEQAFGVSMNLLRMQATYDAAQARARADKIDVQRFVPAEPDRSASPFEGRLVGGWKQQPVVLH